MRLLQFVGFPLVLLASHAPASADEAAAIPLRFVIYPHGLYPDSPARPPVGNQPRAGGGYDVLAQLTGVTGIRTDAVLGSAENGEYLFSNLRVASAQTTYDDYLQATYSFDLATQRLMPVRFEKAPGVGIYEPTDRLLIKDNPAALNFHTNPAIPDQFLEHFGHTFQSGTDYFADLTAGQRLGFTLSGMPGGRVVRLVMTLQDGTIYADSRLSTVTGGTVAVSAAGILVSGKYRLRLEAVTPATAFSYTIRFYNENFASTTNVVSGNSLAVSLGLAAGGYGLPYKKYRVTLTVGQTVSIPGDADTVSYLINSRGAVIMAGGNVGLNKTVTESGDYYIVLAPLDETNTIKESYNGSLTITNDLGFLDWSQAHELPYGLDKADQDADRDGVANLLEYAFGMNPRRRDPGAAPQPDLAPSLVTLTYQRPDYLRGVTVQPEFSSTGQTWGNVTPVAGSTYPGGSIMTASSPRNGAKGFGRVRVSPAP